MTRNYRADECGLLNVKRDRIAGVGEGELKKEEECGEGREYEKRIDRQDGGRRGWEEKFLFVCVCMCVLDWLTFELRPDCRLELSPSPSSSLCQLIYSTESPGQEKAKKLNEESKRLE